MFDLELTSAGESLLDGKKTKFLEVKMFMRKYCTLLVLVLVAVSVARAGNWPHWRGPHFNGSTDEKDLPSNWSKTEKILWSVDLAGSSAATPIIWGNKVFLSGVDSDRDMLLAMCFDRTNRSSPDKLFFALFKKNIFDANQSEVILGTISS